MSFWSSRPAPPVGPVTRAWIEGRFRWLLAEFGEVRALRPVVLPTPEFFPEPYGGTAVHVRRLFPRVAAYMGIDPARVSLGFHDEASSGGRSAQFVAGPRSGVPGWFEPGDPPRIFLRASGLGDALAVVGTLAHELGHVHLLAGGRVRCDAEDHEPLTDLLTVTFGLGVFRARCLADEASPRRMGRGGLAVAAAGYLTAPMFGYAFALHARLRGEGEDAPWARFLLPPVRTAFARGLRLLGRS